MPGTTVPFPDVVPELSDGVVTLRAHRQSDVPALVEQCTDPEMVRFTTVPQPYDVQQAQLFLGTVVPGGWAEEHGSRTWAIEAQDGNDPAGVPRFCGSVDYRPTPDGIAEIGFGLHPWARGRGLMSRAVRLAAAHAFDHGIETLHWRAAVGNWGSRRVAWACGFKVEGTVRDLLALRGDRRDGWIGTLRRGEPMAPAHPWLETPVLEGERVRLRPWRPDDRPRPDQAPDEVSRRFMSGFVPTAETFDEWLLLQQVRPAEGDSVVWCIADAATDQPLGSTNVFRLSFQLMRGSGMVAYWLHPDARGRGAATEALALLTAHAFTSADDGGLGLHRLEAGTDIDNRGSQRVLRRAGFRQAGHQHRVMAREDGPAADGLQWELLRDDRAQPVAPVIPAVLETDRLRLREWRETDRPRADQRVDPASARFMPAGAQPDADTFDEWLGRKRRDLDAGTACHWCVADRETDAALGCVQVFGIGDGSPGNAELGYWLFAEARGRGLALEAVTAAVEQAFRPEADGGLGLRRLHASTDLANLASQEILRRTGFRLWGLDHQSYARPDGSISDGAFFELLADEHRAPSARPGHPAYRPVVLADDRVRLRPFREEDAAALARLLRHEDAGPFADPAADEGTARRWLTHAREAQLSGRAVRWAVTRPGEDTPLGYLTTFRLDDGFHRDGCELGYWLAPEARGAGLASAAVRLLLGHVFTSLEDGGWGLRRVRAITSPENLASRAVLRRAGFRQWGVEPEAVARGSFGAQRTAHQGCDPSPDRLQFAVTQHQWQAPEEHAPLPTLKGEGVRLREWRHTDVARVREACSDERTRHWLAGMPDPYTEADAAAYLAMAADRNADGSDRFWCVADATDDRCVGSLTVHGAGAGDPRGASIGYWTHPDARGQGFMSEALRLVSEHAFAPRAEGGLGLPRLSLVAGDGNTASQHVARSAGFRRSGIDRASDRLGDGSVVDWVRFDLLPGDLEVEPHTTPVRLDGRPGEQGPGVRLRAWRTDDIPRIVEACTDPVTRHWLATLPDPYDEATARGYLEMVLDEQRAGRKVSWCVADPATDVCLGSLALTDLGGLDPTYGEIGYWAHPDARGRGVMRQAVGLVVRHAFVPTEDGGLGLRRLGLFVADGNDASARIALAHGFIETGRDRAEDLLGDGSYADLRRFDLLATEWEG